MSAESQVDIVIVGRAFVRLSFSPAELIYRFGLLVMDENRCGSSLPDSDPGLVHSDRRRVVELPTMKRHSPSNFKGGGCRPSSPQLFNIVCSEAAVTMLDLFEVRRRELVECRKLVEWHGWVDVVFRVIGHVPSDQLHGFVGQRRSGVVKHVGDFWTASMFRQKIKTENRKSK